MAPYNRSSTINPTILHSVRYSILAVHPEEHRRYSSSRRLYCCQDLSISVYNTTVLYTLVDKSWQQHGQNFPQTEQNSISNISYSCFHYVIRFTYWQSTFSAHSREPGQVANALWHLPDRYSSRTCAISTLNTVLIYVAYIFEYSVITYGVLDTTLPDNTQPFIITCFITLCNYPGNKISLDCVPPQTNEQVIRYHRAPVLRLWLDMADNQQARGIFVQPLIYRYIYQPSRSTNFSAFFWQLWATYLTQ